MSFYPAQKKHKAMHRGYKSKPRKKDVVALMNMYSAIGSTTVSRPTKQEAGKQLTLNLK